MTEKVGGFQQFKCLIESKGYELFGDFADSYEDAELLIADLKSKQVDWFKDKPNEMIDLNIESGVDVLGFIELIKIFIDRKFITIIEAEQFGKII